MVKVCFVCKPGANVLYFYFTQATERTKTVSVNVGLVQTFFSQPNSFLVSESAGALAQ